MTQIKVMISDEKARELEEHAQATGVTVDEFVRRILEAPAQSTYESVGATDPRYLAAKDYILKKNAELYRRLA
jgi:hypothetical protein